jgi:hypothetical protein
VKDDSFYVFIFYEKQVKYRVLREWAELVVNQLTQKLLIKLMCKKTKLRFYKISEACLPMICYSLLAIQSYLLNCNLVLIDGCIPNDSWGGVRNSPIL